MKIKAWHPEAAEITWEFQQAEMLAFVLKYGRKAISADTYRALMKLTSRDMLLPGASLMMATIQTEDGARLAGLSCVTDFGRGISFVLIHPLYRGMGLGSKLLSRQLAVLGQLTCRVSPSHISSLKMCFRAGLTASRLVNSRGGRTELLFESKRDSIENTFQRR